MRYVIGEEVYNPYCDLRMVIVTCTYVKIPETIYLRL